MNEKLLVNHTFTFTGPEYNLSCVFQRQESVQVVPASRPTPGNDSKPGSRQESSDIRVSFL